MQDEEGEGQKEENEKTIVNAACVFPSSTVLIIVIRYLGGGADHVIKSRRDRVWSVNCRGCFSIRIELFKKVALALEGSSSGGIIHAEG
jgi:hypothetical protein